MKRIIPALMIGLAVAAIVMAFSSPEVKTAPIDPQDQTALFPEDISKIFETSCYDCHSATSSNAKAKTKLNFGNWAEMSAAKKVGKIENIMEVVNKGDMPPAKYLEKKPEAALSKEQKDAIQKWGTEESDKLMGQGK